MFSQAARWRAIPVEMLVIYLLVMVLVSGASGEARNETTEFRMLWTVPTPLQDFGFSYSIDRARLKLEDRFIREGVLVSTHLMTNLSVPECASVVLQFLHSGLPDVVYDVWVIGGQQYSGCVAEVERETAKEPLLANMKFLHLAGANASERVAAIAPAMYEVQFLHGLLCAQASEQAESRSVGFVTAVPRTNTVISQSLNAYSLGVKHWNRSLEVLVGITGAFLHPVAERKATEMLLTRGVGCVTQQQNGLTVNYVTNAANIWSIGYVTDARIFTGSSLVLSSMDLNWEQTILATTRSILEDRWQPNLVLESGFANNSIGLRLNSPEVHPEWRDPINQWIDRFKMTAPNSNILFCTPNFTDAQYMNKSEWIEPSPTDANQTCLNQFGFSQMLGVSNDAQIVVEFGENNSPYVIVWVKWSQAGPIFFMAFLGIIILAAIGSMVDVAFNRQSPVYRASSPLFCFLILIGVVIAAFAPYLMIGERTKYRCMAPWWMLGIGYSLIFSCLMAKNWRIWRIFASGRFKVVAIMNAQLISRWVGGILGLELLILSLWTALDPQLPKTTSNPELAYDELQLMCASKSGKSIGLTTFLTYNVAILVPLALISWRTRHAKEEYRESRAIAMVVLTAVIVNFTGIGVLVALPDDYLTYYYIFSFGTSLILLVVLGTLFLPKIWRIHFPSSGISSPDSGGTSQGVSYLQSQPPPDSMTGIDSRSRPSFTAGSLGSLASRSDRNHSNVQHSRDHISRDVHHPNQSQNSRR